jgi:hypothetical protein
MVGHPSGIGDIFLLAPILILGPFSLEGISPTSCHCCATGYLPAGGSQLPPGSTKSSGQFLWLLASLCSLFLAPVPLLPSFDWFHYGVFNGDFFFFCHLRFSVH